VQPLLAQVDALKIARQNDEFKTEDNKRRAEALKIERLNVGFRTQENERRLRG
jgi:hypothetical protein